MEKYKTIVQIEKIKKCLEEGKCTEALEVAEKVDKKRIKNVSDLGIVAESYFQNQRYETAKELFLRIYEKSRSRRVVAQLVHLSIRLEEINEAEDYLEEFIEIAPLDFYQYIFRYSIDKLKKMPLVKLIEDLEELKKAEYIESWAYELAKLYHKAGLKDRCIAECNDIILWFGEGDYVERARALRAYYLGELDPTLFTEEKEVIKKKQEPKEVEKQEAEGMESIAVENSSEDEVEKDDDMNEEFPPDTMNYQESHDTMNSEDMEEVLLHDDTNNDSKMISMSTDEEDEISLAVAQVIDQIFEGNGIENSPEAETQSKEESEWEVNKVQNQEAINAADTQSEEQQSINSISVDSINEDRINEDSIKEDNIKEDSIETRAQSQDDENSEERYSHEKEDTLLSSLDAPEKDSRVQQNISSEDFKENEKIEDISNNEEHKQSMQKKLQKKIQLKAITNEQLLGEEAEDLLSYLQQRQINLADIFGYFVRNESVQKQLVRSIDQALAQKSSSINLIITGEEKSGKTRLSKCIAKLLYRMNLVASTKVALVDGEKLNSIPMLSKKEQLSDCVMVIERAGRMTKDTIRTLIKLREELHGHVVIILEDTRENINHLLRENSFMNGVFNNRIHLPKYTLEDYMGFAYDYISEKEFEIEREAYIALQNDFSTLMMKKRENTLTAIFSCLDQIMCKTEKRSAANLKTMTETGQFGIAELMVIKKEDL